MTLAGRLSPLRWVVLGVLALDALLFLANAIFGGNDSIPATLSFAVGLANFVALGDAIKVLSAQTVGPVGTPARRGRERFWCRGSVVVAQLAAIPYLAFPIWAEAGSKVHDATDLLLCVGLGALLVAAAAIVVVSLYLRSDQLPRQGLAVLLALVVPAASLADTYYTVIYKTQHQRPVINIDAQLVRDGSTSTATEFHAQMNLKNDGSTGVVFLEALYTVTAYNIPDVSAAQSHRARNTPQDPQPAFKDPRASYNGLVQIGRLIRRGGHLATGQNLNTSVVFKVDNNAGQMVRLTVMLAVLTDNGRQIDNSFLKCSPFPRTSYECWKVQVPGPGWLSEQLSDHPLVQASLIRSAPDGIPAIDTRFFYGDAGSQKHVTAARAETVYPFINSRNFTTSVEKPLP